MIMHEIGDFHLSAFLFCFKPETSIFETTASAWCGVLGKNSKPIG